MDLVVKKFGGTSVGNIERIKRVADLIAKSDDKAVVVVSAMAGTTNELVKFSQEVGIGDSVDEYDTVISAGEQITVGLVSLALQSVGIKARSYLGWQVPIITSGEHGNAKILEIQTGNLMADIEDGIVPVIAGFQGIHGGRITTLGRGGSDTTAVAIAVAMQATRCDIYTDVDGIFTGDPRVVTKARKIDRIDYSSVLEMASSGSKVIHPRAVEIAMQSNLPIRILNTFSDYLGTEISNFTMEKSQIIGIAVKNDLSLMKISRISPSELNQIINDLTHKSLKIESVSQSNLSLSEDRKVICDYSFVFSSEYASITTHENFRSKLAKISIVGIGLKNDSEITSAIMDILEGIEVISMQFLETQISFVIEEAFSDQVVRNIHTRLGLDASSAQ